PARSSKARATAVMASAPPRRSYREPSTVPTSCALVINDSATFPASRTGKPCHRGQVNLYRLLTGQTEGPAGAWGRGAAKGPSRLRTTRQPGGNRRPRRALAPPQPRTSRRTAAPAAWSHDAPRDRGQTSAAPTAAGGTRGRSFRTTSIWRAPEVRYPQHDRGQRAARPMGSAVPAD